MKKILQNITVGIIILAFFVPFLAKADGMIAPIDWNPKNPQKRDLIDEISQNAFINFENGLEKMIINVELDRKNRDAVWIFPVPASPEDIVLDVLTRLPSLSGVDIKQEAKNKVPKIGRGLRGSQIYPWILRKMFMPLGGPLIGGRYYDFPSATYYSKERLATESEVEVIIHEVLEKEGMTLELITAKRAGALYNYLKEKGLNIKEGSIPVLDEYIGKDYSFVIAWITSKNRIISKSGTEQRGVFITFPAPGSWLQKKMYYPLLPTSIYESKKIPITVRVLGFVSPKIFQKIKSYTSISYWQQRSLSIPEELKDFYGNIRTEKVKYTKIEIKNAPSKYLVDDLWIIKRTPFKISFASGLYNHPFLIGILFLLILSIISGLMAGNLIFRKKTWKYGLLGLANLLSLIGLIIATVIMRTKKPELSEKAREVLEELKKAGFSIRSQGRRKFYFILVFTIIFIILTYGLETFLNSYLR